MTFLTPKIRPFSGFFAKNTPKTAFFDPKNVAFTKRKHLKTLFFTDFYDFRKNDDFRHL
jgi:hypothetical protein